jgi:LPS-assembly protein
MRSPIHAVLLAVLLIPLQQDPTDTITVEGDQSFVDGVATVRNNPVVTYQDMRFEADQIITYIEASGELTAGDRVTFTRGDEQLTGEGLEFNVRTRSGIIRNATGQLSASLLIDAALARRLEDGTYELTDVTITTCDDDGNPIWNFHTPSTTYDPETGISAKHSVIKIKGFPVFYMPYLSAPVSDQPRASGFLTPQTSTSTTKGRSVSQSYYYAINRSADVTATGEYFSRRGLGGAVDFRAVPDDRSRVEISSFFAHDRLDEGGHSTRILSYTERGKLRAVADMDIISSFTFRQVFAEGFDLISSPTETSKAFASYNTPALSYNFLYSRQGTFFVDQPTTILRKLPSLELGVYSQAVGNLPVYFSFDGGVAGLHRRDGTIESPSFVQRFDLYPRVEIPVIRGGAFSWSHTVGVRNTYYSHSRQPQVERDALNRLSVDYGFEFTGPRIERDFGAWRHTFEPYVDYRYVSGVDRFSDTLHIDDVDLFANTNEVRYGFSTRLFKDREILSWTVSQKYFSDPDFGGALVSGRDNVFEPLLDLTGFGFADERRRFSPVVSRVSYLPGGGTNADFQLDYDTIKNQFRSAGLIGGHRTGLAFYSLAYFFTRRSAIQPANNQLRGTLGFGDSSRPGFNALFSFAYDIGQSFFQASTAQLSYNTDCYGLHLEFMQFDVGQRRESRVRFSFSLKDLGSIGTLRRQDQLF